MGSALAAALSEEDGWEDSDDQDDWNGSDGESHGNGGGASYHALFLLTRSVTRASE